jgi:hypothetical protein
MRFLFIALLSLFAFSSSAQSKGDYEMVLGRFKHFYNQHQADSIINMFARPEEARASGMWTPDRLKYLHKEFGMFRSANHMGDENGLALLRTIFVRSVHIMGLQLDEHNKITILRFKLNTERAHALLGNTP